MAPTIKQTVDNAIISAGRVLNRFAARDEGLDRAREACIAQGGHWDSERNVCIMPRVQQNPTNLAPQPQEPTAAQTTLETPEVFRNETGRTSGIALPDGRTFLGLSPEEVERVAEGEAEKTQLPAGTAPVGTAVNVAAQQQRIQQAIAQIGQVGGLTPEEEAAINWSQAATAGAAGILPSLGGAGAAGLGGLLSGAASGAVAGTAVGGPIGTAIGAVLGLGAAGFISGTIGNIKSQQKGEIAAGMTELTAARTNMRQLAMLASRDPANADYYISLYNVQLTRVYQARRKVAAETSGDLNAWIDDGTEQLAEFDAFLQPNGTADIYGQRLQQALLSGVPLSIVGDQLFLEDELSTLQ